MLQVLDPRRTIGRGNYLLVSTAFFFFVVVAGGVLYLLMSALATAASNVQEPWQSLIGWIPHPWVFPLPALFRSLAFILLLLPLEMRRARDMHMHLAWLLPKLIAYCIPAVSTVTFFDGALRGIWLLLGAYAFVIERILIFAPGDQFKHAMRERQS